MNLTNDPGLWQHFINRFDNVGRPIMEVKQKYLLEINVYESTLASGNPGAGGGTARKSTLPTVYTYNLGQCCGSLCSATAYSTSPSIIVGAIFYSNPQLTILFAPPCNPMLEGCISDQQTSSNGILFEGGVVTSITEVVGCFD